MEPRHNPTSCPDKSCSEATLWLDCPRYGMSKTNMPEYSKSSLNLHLQGDGCQLALGLGPASSSSHRNCFQSGINKNKQPSAHSSYSLCSETKSQMLELGLSCGAKARASVLAVDEGSTTAKRSSGGYIPSLLFAPRFGGSDANDSQPKETCDIFLDDNAHLLRVGSDPSHAINSSAGTLFHSASSYPQSHIHHPKRCGFCGCSKGARGVTGLCIAHGGGQRCQKPGCNKGAESKTVFCKAHGGGRRCHRLGCTKSADSKTDFCIAHGGGQRCGDPGCTKAARGKAGLCIKHGGGKRCTTDGCNRSAEGQAGLCISHGGGHRCQHPSCPKGAQGSTKYCKAHGGGKRCIFEGCTKGAEGSTPLCKGHGGGKRCLFEGDGVCPKSVHGGTNYCVAHGGGKRCAMSDCTRSARGRTDCCVKHGGGRRCQLKGCGKSAQGSTDLCKTHGGGKRCTWHERCDKFARGKSGLCAAHGNINTASQSREFGSMIQLGLFRGLVPMSTMIGSSTEDENSTMEMNAILDSVEMPARQLLEMEQQQQRQLIPLQVLVPLSMKAPLSLSVGGEGGQKDRSMSGSSNVVIPEGRVHGGGLMFRLGGSFKDDPDVLGI